MVSGVTRTTANVDLVTLERTGRTRDPVLTSSEVLSSQF
jgi:hypothetical protein